MVTVRLAGSAETMLASIFRPEVLSVHARTSIPVEVAMAHQLNTAAVRLRESFMTGR